jgi:two-component system, OmpR family, phosphate regulon sensor histidine kinase PhoR
MGSDLAANQPLGFRPDSTEGLASRSAREVTVYQLPLEEEPAPSRVDPDVLDLSLLQQNACWFCRLRWIVVVLLATAGCAAGLGLPLHPGGLRLSATWPLCAASSLAALNVLYTLFLPRSGARHHATWLTLHVWLQIIIDLVVLTVAIHYLGSVETPAVFMYLFHIILACIFFPPLQSLAVVATSASLYLACLAIETVGWVASTTILAPGGLPDRYAWSAGSWLVHLGFIFLIWLVIWYLASRLAGALRQRDRNLAKANARLQASSEERARHMLQTTHQLKAPFAAIHANAQLLLRGTCGSLPAEARAVVERIAARCALLSQQVIDMLQLANLRSTGQTSPTLTELDLATVMQASVTRFDAAAGQRGIRIQGDFQPCAIHAAEDHLKMLIDNLLSNAINYSRDGGTVFVSCGSQPDGMARIVVSDEGIGIPADKLPRIFEDYYRTSEAARHNKESTGLGLAIVRHVAQRAGIRVQVESCQGQGTRFTLAVPAKPGHTASWGAPSRVENAEGPEPPVSRSN